MKKPAHLMKRACAVILAALLVSYAGTPVLPVAEPISIRASAYSYTDAGLVLDGSRYYVNMPGPSDGMMTIDLTGLDTPISDGFMFHVYDDGGESSDYSSGLSSQLQIIVPEGFKLNIAGKIQTDGKDDYLAVYDSDDTLAEKYYSGNGGTDIDITPFTSKGSSMFLNFVTNDYNNNAGLDLCVTLVSDAAHDVKKAVGLTGGDITFSKTSAKPGETVTVTALPDSGNRLDTVTVFDANGNAVATRGGMANGECTFVMPPMAVKVEASFMGELDANLYYTIPSSGTLSVDIPSGLETFIVKTASMYENNADGKLELTAPEGYGIIIEGNVYLSDSGDVLTVKDSSGSVAAKASGMSGYVDKTYSGGRTMTLELKTNGEGRYEDISIWAKLYSLTEQKLIEAGSSISDGTLTLSPDKAKIGETVTMKAVPDSGYSLYYVDVHEKISSRSVKVFTDWINNELTFDMPDDDVVVTPYFTDTKEYYNLSMNMPTTGTREVTIPEDVLSFSLYDDGGDYENYSDSSDGRLIVHAPAGKKLDVDLFNKSLGDTSDYLEIYARDGDKLEKLQEVSENSDYFSNLPKTADTLEFVFTSNASNNDSGFYIGVYVVDDSEAAATHGISLISAPNGAIDEVKKGTDSVSAAKAGDKLKVEATPAAGYVLNSVFYVESNTDKAPVFVKTSYKDSAALEFTMPDDDIQLFATFVDKASVETPGVYWMVNRENQTVELSASNPSVTIYDDSGTSSSNYGDHVDSTLTLTVPEGKAVKLTSSRFETEGYSWDNLFVYRGTSAADENLMEKFGGTSSVTVNRTYADTITLRFKTDGGGTYQGFELKAELTDPTARNITCIADANGDITAPAAAASCEEVTVEGTPKDGYVFNGITVKEVLLGKTTTYTGGWYADNKISFIMPDGDVEITPIFVEKKDAYVYMQSSGVLRIAPPKEITSFHIYDDGGKDSWSSNPINSAVVITAPDGVFYKISGRAEDGMSGRPNYGVYDSENTDLSKEFDHRLTNYGYYYGDHDFEDHALAKVSTFAFLTGTANGNVNIEVKAYGSLSFAVNAEESENGTVIAPKTAKSGEVVTVKFAPKDGYTLGGFSVIDKNGNKVPTTGGIAELSDEGTFVMPNSMVTIVPQFVKDEEFALRIPVSGMTKVNITDSKHFNFKVYDDGGADGDYGKTANGALLLTAPEGYVFEASGNADLGGQDSAECGYFSAYEYEGMSTLSEKYNTNGENVPIARFASSGNALLLTLANVNGAAVSSGLDLSVNIVPKNASYKVKVEESSHGTLTAKASGDYRRNSIVRFKASADDGYFLKSVEAKDANGVPVKIEGGWFTENEIAFTMPGSDVTLTPVFTNDPTAEGGLFVDQSHYFSGITIPKGVKSFCFYDDGGKDGRTSGYDNFSHTIALADDYGGENVYHLQGTVNVGKYGDFYTYYDWVSIAYASSTDGPKNFDVYTEGTDKELKVETYYNQSVEGIAVKVSVEPKVTSTVTVEDSTGGTFTASRKVADMGDTVFLSSEPQTGYMLADVIVTPEGGEPYSLTNGFTTEKNIKFTMGSKSVTLKPVYTNDLTAEGGLYKKLSLDGYETTLKIPDNVKSFKVYDDGGKDGNYDPTMFETLVIASDDADTRFVVSGTVTAYTSETNSGHTYWLGIAKEYMGNFTATFNSRTNGEKTDIGTFTTSYNKAYFAFSGGYDYESFEGLDLTVTVKKLDTATSHGITVRSAEHGAVKAKNSADVDITTALYGDTVAVKTDGVDSGYVLSDVIITDENGDKVPYTGGWYSGNTAYFTMPDTAVEVTPVFTNDLTAEGGLFVNLTPDPTADKNSSEIKTEITVPAGVKSFRIYDDGGKDGLYSRGYNGVATIEAEVGKKVMISGSYSLGDNTDVLKLYNDTSSVTPMQQYAGSGSGSVTSVLSLANTAKVQLQTDNYGNDDGIDLLVSVVDPAVDYIVSKGSTEHAAVTFAGDAQTLSAKAGDTITFNVTPEEGYLVTDILAEADGAVVETFGGRWYSGSTSVTFAMPADNVTITPVCTSAHSAEEGLYINMPKMTGGMEQTLNMTIPDSVTSFKLYDDGGSDGMASVSYKGTIKMNVKENYHPSVAGTVYLRDSVDFLSVISRDASDSNEVSAAYDTYYARTAPVSAEAPNKNVKGEIYFRTNGIVYDGFGIDLTVNIAPDKQTIYFYSDKGTFEGDCDSTMTYTVEGVDELPKMKAHGYKHTGWTFDGVNYTDSISAADALDYIKNYGDISLTAGWEIDPYRDFTLSEHMKVTDSTEPSVGGRYKMGTVVTVKIDDGYEVVGDLSDGTNNIAAENGVYKITVGDPDVTVTGTVKPIDYNVTYEGVDGAENENPAAYNIESDDITLNDASKTGYTFTGWTYGSVKTPEKNVKITKGSTGNKTFKANWTVNSYTVTFDPDNGSDKQTSTVEFDKAITAPADPTREGYTFAGWDKKIPAKMPAEDLTFKAKWTVNKYTITFDTKGGSEIAAITQDYGTAVTAPADPTREGYTFAGWDTEIPATVPAKDMTITAKWTENPKPDTESDTKPDTESDTKPDTESDTKPDTESDTKPDTETDTKPDTESDTKPDIESDTKPDTESDTKPDTESDTKPDTETDTKPDTESDTKPDTESDTKPDTETDTKPDTENDTKPDTETDTKPDTETDTKPDTETDTKPDTETDTKPDTETDTKPDTDTETKPDTDTEAESDTDSDEQTRFEVDGVVYEKNEDGSVNVTDVAEVSDDGIVTIHGQINGMPVDTIAKDAFAGKDNIKSVRIEDGVKKIEEGTFDGMKLDNIVLYGKDTEIPENSGLDKDTVVFGFKGSNAETSAENSGNDFIPLDEGFGMLGDINCDSVVDSADALIILRMGAGVEISGNAPKLLADVNEDSAVDSSDALSVLRYSVGSSVDNEVGKKKVLP